MAMLSGCLALLEHPPVTPSGQPVKA